MIALLRINLDVEPREFKHSLRLKLAAKDIRNLLHKYDKVVILSHRGRPEKSNKRFSLMPSKKYLESGLKQNIVFFDAFDFQKIRQKIESSPEKIFMLENLRFLKGEFENSSSLAKNLASLGNIFINDDFASSHRKNASISAITKFIKSEAGNILKSETKHLDAIRDNPKKPIIFIVGGAKISDKLGVIEKFIDETEYVLTGGGAANTFLKAADIPINGSLFEKKMIPRAKKLLKSGKIIIPTDYRKQKGNILDIGPKTTKIYNNLIKIGRTIVWAGPLGYIEKPAFAKGSAAILKAIEKSHAKTVIGGGETTSFALKHGFKKTVCFLSTGGGAMLQYLAGEEMPGIESLKIKSSKHEK
jgi:phosphoglycerate kinase